MKTLLILLLTGLGLVTEAQLANKIFPTSAAFRALGTNVNYAGMEAMLNQGNTDTLTNANEIWVSPIGINGTGNGSQKNPYVATNAAAFDALFGAGVYPHTNNWPINNIFPPTNSIIPVNTVINLTAGTFHTATNDGIVMQSGWRIRGAGIDKTILVHDPGQAMIIIGGDSAFLPCGRNNMSVEDLTIDMNQQNQPAGQQNSQAIVLTGDNALIKNVKVINWGANTSTEQFILVIAAYGGNFYGYVETNLVHNAVIDGCVLGYPSPQIINASIAGSDFVTINGQGFYGNTSNGTSIMEEYPATLNPTNGWIIGGEIKNCTMEGNLLITTNTGYFNFASYTAVQGLKIDHNILHDLTRNTLNRAAFGTYNEDGPWQDLEICDNFMVNVCSGIVQGSAVSTGSSDSRSDLKIHNNTILFSGTPFSQGISVSSSNTNLNGAIIQNNYIAAYGGVTNINTSAIFVGNATNLSVIGNYLNNYGAVEFQIQNNPSILQFYGNWNGQGTNPVQDVTQTYYPNTYKADQFVGTQVVLHTNMTVAAPAAIWGSGILWNSNNALYWITPMNTNHVAGP
jgi:hypothetical protein